MNKAILVMNMPENCGECPVSKLNIKYSKVECRCSVEYTEGTMCRKSVDMYTRTRPDWCPLKPAPERIDVPAFDYNMQAKNKNAEEVGMYMYNRGHYRGYNICVREILGE